MNDISRLNDERYMAATVAYARRTQGLVWPNPSVGALIVKGGVVQGRGVTQRPGGPHAEVMALRQAGEAARGASCYVTLEPCSHQGRTGPCAVALAEAGVKRVIIGLRDPNPRVAGRGEAILRERGVEVVSGVAADLCHAHHIGHVRRVLDGRPQVILKLAVSQDGCIGRRGYGQVAITGEGIGRRVHILRAECDGIMVGIGTALADDPLLNCRLPGLESRSPVRVILDTAARLPLDSKLVRGAADVPVWVLVGNGADYARTDALRDAGCTVVRLATLANGRIDPLVALRALGQRGLTRLLVEGGASVARAFVDRGVADEVIISRGNIVVGEGGIPPFGDRGIDFFERMPDYRLVARQCHEGEQLQHYRRERG
ncbi:bifunctional diaminohydroxyphosphoribosylaminopyrimidine deaminase/5-amino-6-(5-phosphoribosylamino)uracil reductase RibD [Stappia taiwanensis]